MTQAPDQRPRLLLVDDEPTNLQGPQQKAASMRR